MKKLSKATIVKLSSAKGVRSDIVRRYLDDLVWMGDQVAWEKLMNVNVATQNAIRRGLIEMFKDSEA